MPLLDIAGLLSGAVLGYIDLWLLYYQLRCASAWLVFLPRLTAALGLFALIILFGGAPAAIGALIGWSLIRHMAISREWVQ